MNTHEHRYPVGPCSIRSQVAGACHSGFFAAKVRGRSTSPPPAKKTGIQIRKTFGSRTGTRHRVQPKESSRRGRGRGGSRILPRRKDCKRDGVPKWNLGTRGWVLNPSGVPRLHPCPLVSIRGYAIRPSFRPSFPNSIWERTLAQSSTLHPPDKRYDANVTQARNGNAEAD